MKKRRAHLIPGVFNAESVLIKPKDFTQSPFRYPGGKWYALKYIIPILDSYPHDEYIEPFVGGGSVFFGKAKARFNWINDLEKVMVITYKAIQSPKRCQTLVQRVSRETASRERHGEVKAYVPKTHDDIAYRTYYLNRTSYSGIINKPAWGYETGFSAPPANWTRFLNGAHAKLSGVKITNEDFAAVLDSPCRGERPLFYLDPPYYLADQKRAYTQPFVHADHVRLEEQLRTFKHAFVLSYDDCDEVRALYSWAYLYEQSWFYNTANSKGPRKVGKELFITNFKVNHHRQLELL